MKIAQKSLENSSGMFRSFIIIFLKNIKNNINIKCDNKRPDPSLLDNKRPDPSLLGERAKNNAVKYCCAS